MFATKIAEQVTTIVRETAGLNETYADATKKRGKILEHQRKLNQWLDSHGRNVTLAKCKTEEDKRNYRDFKNVMAGHRLLTLPLRERIKRVQMVKNYCHSFTKNFTTAIKAVIPPSDKSTLSEHIYENLNKQLRTPLKISRYFFGRNQQSMIASVYLPAREHMFLNLDFLADNPQDFRDAFEHELWHHLIPIPDDLRISQNLWWEGCNELFSEVFGSKLDDLNNASSTIPHSRSVEYPIQTAFCSLLFANNQQATVAFANSAITRDELAEKLINKISADGAINKSLGEVLQASHRIDQYKKQRLEKTLGDWGWRENNGTEIDIGYLLQNERLADDKLNREFKKNRRFLMDLIQALTVTNIQELKKQRTDYELRKSASALPSQLRHNLRRVLEYCDNPYYQLSQR